MSRGDSLCFLSPLDQYVSRPPPTALTRGMCSWLCCAWQVQMIGISAFIRLGEVGVAACRLLAVWRLFGLFCVVCLHLSLWVL